MKIATWNVNSLKIRLPQVLDWLKQQQPDILAIQETKLTDEKFPLQDLQELGYETIFCGQPTYNGVAILAKHKIENSLIGLPNYADEQKRLLAATIKGVRVINVYIPNGASVGSEKYQYKLAWLTQLQLFIQAELAQHDKLIILGDFNIAPTHEDVCDPIAWEGNVLVSPAERAHFQALIDLGLHDSFRLFPQAPKSYSWWDYRAAAFRRNLGLRIDHILVSSTLVANCTACVIDKIPRKHERPSDHAPVMLTLEALIKS